MPWLYLEQVVTGGLDHARDSQCRMALAYVYSVTGRHRLAEYELERLRESGYESVQSMPSSVIRHGQWTGLKRLALVRQGIGT